MTTALCACILVLGAACADDRPGTATLNETPGNIVEVVAIDNTFRPETIEISVGDEVVWVNRGRNEHDVLDVAGTWGAQVEDFEPGDEFRHVFTEPGTFRYYCSLHGTTDVGMIGVVVVTN